MTAPRPARPRWSNTRIGRLPMQVKRGTASYTAQSIIDACTIVRNDYELEYCRLCQRIAELTVLLERERDKWRALAERNAELENSQ